ncbi:putative transcription factor B3-Domain family [Helianthus annuus]|nr:putative transcription factor B3-Domain family [Helianthus annuus]
MVVISNEDYEELRKRRMEENKRRMEELHLHQLTQALKHAKPPPMKLTQPPKIGAEMVEIRRSNRVANKPARVYNPDRIFKQIVAQGSSSKSSRSLAMTKAVEVRLSLGTEHPSFIKIMKGQVVIAGPMAFPITFWKLFVLPKVDSEMVIEDENREIYHVKYCYKQPGLSAGWKKFAAGHNLLDGDVLVFHLVEPYKFKVYIVRANDLKKADDLITRLNLEARNKQMTSETNTLSPTRKKTKRAKPLSSSQIISQIMEQLGNNSEAFGSEVLGGFRPFKPDLPSQELDGVYVDSELPGETVNIANEIYNCKFTTTKEELEAWDNSLKSFSQLGMKVGFLSERIATRSRLMFESESRLDIERYMEAKTEHKHIEDEIKRFTDELKKLEESSRKIQEDLKHKAGRYEVKFQEEVPLTTFQ